MSVRCIGTPSSRRRRAHQHGAAAACRRRAGSRLSRCLRRPPAVGESKRPSTLPCGLVQRRLAVPGGTGTDREYAPHRRRRASVSSFIPERVCRRVIPEAGYIFNEHAVHGPPDKIFEEAAFLERFRDLLVMEDGENLWLARATPRTWLAQGQKISVKHAPTHFGNVDYEIVWTSIMARSPPTWNCRLAIRFAKSGCAPSSHVGTNEKRDRQWEGLESLRSGEGNRQAARPRAARRRRSQLLTESVEALRIASQDAFAVL